MEHSLEVERILDKLGNKYEALVRMSIKAKQLADDGTVPANEKVTMVALQQFVAEQKFDAPAPATKK